MAHELITDDQGNEIHRQLADLGAHKIELFWTYPKRLRGSSDRPLLLYVHGDQSDSIGGAQFLKMGRLQRMADLGFVAASVSLPGFGGSLFRLGHGSGFSTEESALVKQTLRFAASFLKGRPGVSRDGLGVVAFGSAAGHVLYGPLAKEASIMALISPPLTSKLARDLVENSDLVDLAQTGRKTLVVVGESEAKRMRPLLKFLSINQLGGRVEIGVFKDSAKHITLSEIYRLVTPFLKDNLAVLDLSELAKSSLVKKS